MTNIHSLAARAGHGHIIPGLDSSSRRPYNTCQLCRWRSCAARSLTTKGCDHNTPQQRSTVQEEALRGQLDELQEQLSAAQPHIERLRAEKETCHKVVNTLRDKMTAVNDEWQAKFDAFKEAMSKWEVEKDAVRKERCAPSDYVASCSVCGAVQCLSLIHI